MLALLIMFPAFAGYGDTTLDGYPSWGERDVHIWTNIMRVDPEEFFAEGSAWNPGCYLSSFEESEKTPKLPVYYDYDLNDVARYHSIDMYDNDWFDHASSDGTSFGDRVSNFYTESGYIGENIAVGYGNAFEAVFGGWMCSAGHRANIMHADWNELGTGVKVLYYTQDFAAGNVQTSSPIAMGSHTPEFPLETVEFMADFQGFEPDEFDVIVDGERHEMVLTFGESSNGVYTTELPNEGVSDCHQYYFLWSDGMESGTFPEDGSFMYGTTCDSDIMWVLAQRPPSDTLETETPAEEAEAIQDQVQQQIDEADVDVVGCACTTQSINPLRHLGMVLLAGVLGLWRRRD